ncbi:hypothetical protein AOR_1_1520054 [Paecilomyces variotii No. 5]|uniref:Uncharacterized protein n=1 Tax=Byssochlamys spectabilis (strain No. 5 / NBRC 109023) TaxID=1356009 RepID=V5GA79_BYSSN|nr:hypothetical protein AOR_1_1520054 [Paecilomyces variotii No. 5]
MFSWANALALPSVGVDVDKERKPPPRATPLDFPSYELPAVAEGPSKTSFGDLQSLLLAVRKPQDISTAHLRALNLEVHPDVPVADIVQRDSSTIVPPLTWEDDESSTGDKPRTSSGYPYPSRDKFDVVKNELLLDNDDAFREVSRLPPRPGCQRVRLTQSRKFWSGLDRMAQYWDTSLDNYSERPLPADNSSADEKMQMDNKQQADVDESNKMDIDSGSVNNGSPQEANDDKESIETIYTGRRIGTGSDMPEDIREETVRGFIEMAAWPFGCQVTIPTNPPRLTIGNLLFPVRQTLVAGRAPSDRQVAKRGILEGPLLLAQCRPDTVFRDPGQTAGHGTQELCDLFREIGALLLTAQERAREDTREIRPGEGKWWTTEPRWGGAPSEGVTGDGKNSDESSPPEKANIHKRSKLDHALSSSRRSGPGSSRKMSASEKWKILAPPQSLWDKRMKYTQIGKPKDSPFDDIYMVSSINHHISILHLRVHRRYLDALTAGKIEQDVEPADSEQPWHVIQLRRTRWFDFLNATDRVEAFEGLWRVFHYLMRKDSD